MSRRFLLAVAATVSLTAGLATHSAVQATSPSAVAAAGVAATPPPSMPTTGPVVGLRATWQSGDSILEGSRLVPDPQGWLEQNGEFFRLESSGGSGGVGLTQLTVVAADEGRVVADLRQYLNVDLQRNVHVASGFGVVVGDQTGLGEWWVSPAQLAGYTDGFDGALRVVRGQRTIGGQSFRTVALSQLGQNGAFWSRTYDLDSGLLLIGGEMVAAPGVLVTDSSGNIIQNDRGSISVSHQLFAGLRQLTVPWADGSVPTWAQPGTTLNYQGESRVDLGNTGLPPLAGQPLAVSQTVSQSSGGVVLASQVQQSATTAGLPPTEQTIERVYSSVVLDGLWLPAGVAAVEAGTVLDEDPFTGRRTVSPGCRGRPWW